MHDARATATRVLVIDLETTPDPAAAMLLPARARRAEASPATHMISSVSMLQAKEDEGGDWRIEAIKTHSVEGATTETDLLIEIDRAADRLADVDMLVSFNGRRHDLPTIRRRAAAHLLFGRSGLSALNRVTHRDLMTDSIAGGGQWFKLRDVAAGLGIPVAHELPSNGRAVGRQPRKGEVDVASTFLLFLFDLAHRREDAEPVLQGWAALGQYLRMMGPHGEHLAQFRRHPLGRGPDD